MQDAALMRWKFPNEDIMLLLIYRPGAQTACEDLARAISFIFEHAEELEVDTKGYFSGAVQPEPVWQRGLGPMARRHLEGDDLPQPRVQ